MSLSQADRPQEPKRPGRQIRSLDQKRTFQLPRFKLILHSGFLYDLMSVVRTIMELTRFCLAEATHKMWQAHHNGRSVLLVTHKERAELYVEQFADRGIKVTIEPA